MNDFGEKLSRIVIQNFGDIYANNLSRIFKLTSEVIKAHDDSVKTLVDTIESLLENIKKNKNKGVGIGPIMRAKKVLEGYK